MMIRQPCRNRKPPQMPAAVMRWNLTQPQPFLIGKCIQAAYHNLTYFTGWFQMHSSLPMRLWDPTNQFKHDPVVWSFCETLQCSGHWRTFNLLTGKRMLHKGRGSAHDFCWEDNNIPLPLPLSRNRGYVYESGLVWANELLASQRQWPSTAAELVPQSLRYPCHWNQDMWCQAPWELCRATLYSR